MNTIHFDIMALDLSGKETETHLAELFATMLYNHPGGDPLKFADWALKVYNKIPLTLDESDTNTLKEFIKAHQNMTAGLKARLLRQFDPKMASKPKSKEKPKE